MARFDEVPAVAETTDKQLHLIKHEKDK